MSFFSRKKNQSRASTLAPASGLASSQVTQQLQFPANLQSRSRSQSHLQSPQEKRQSQPVCPWSAHAPPGPFEQLPSPFHRESHALSTSATAAGELFLFLFGGYVHGSDSPSNDLYMFSTRDFSTTLLQTSGDVPNPRYGHCAVLTSTILFIWGGTTNFRDRIVQNQALDDSLYTLNLVSREWTRIAVNGPGPGGRRYHTMTLVGSKLFVFGGKSPKGYFNDIWALDLNCLKTNPFGSHMNPHPETRSRLRGLVMFQ
ncbi:hypothetical protein BGY98DRAFT_682872 [Russula aff. rugulosa BPL654]|nr:hypothetical protein BGY98DRAFT_682872 [Russula aff. rugulosa BPL654]